MSETGFCFSVSRNGPNLEQMRCQPAERPDAQRVPFGGRQRCLRNIVAEQLDPAIIAVSEVRQLPGVIGQREQSTRTSAASEPRTPARSRAWLRCCTTQRMQKHLRDQNVITGGSLAIASVRIGLKQNLPLNRSRIFSKPPLHPGPAEICGQGRQSDNVAQVMIAAQQERELAVSLDETKMLPERSGHLIEPGPFFVW